MNPAGNGLGLSICRDICRSLGGDLQLVSTLGKGTKFTFTMDAYFTAQNSERDIESILGKRKSFQRLESNAPEEDQAIPSPNAGFDPIRLVLMKGYAFDLTVSRTRPLSYKDCLFIELPSELKAVVDFLNRMEENGCLADGRNESGRIVFADDQFVNQQQMKMQLKEIGLDERVDMFSNGQDVIDYFETLLDQFTGAATNVQPVVLLLLDIQMPIVDGIDTLLKVKALFEEHNAKTGITILRPMICFLSQSEQKEFA